MGATSPSLNTDFQTFIQKPITEVFNVAPAVVQKLARLDIHRIFDLLLHLPIRYEDETRVTAIADVQLSKRASIVGKIIRIQEVGKKRRLQVDVSDETGMIRFVYFHFFQSLKQKFKLYDRVQAFGNVDVFQEQLVMHHPRVNVLKEGEIPTVLEYLTPVYPTTEGLAQHVLRRLIKKALSLIQPLSIQSCDEITQYFKDQLSFKEALFFIHQPPPDAALQQLGEYQHPAQMRLILEEFIAYRAALIFTHQKTETSLCTPVISESPHHVAQLCAQFPFTLTHAQQRVAKEVSTHLASGESQLHLVQGDVGSGKTVIAALAMVQAAASGFQAALMAPTDLLSFQHFQKLSVWLKPLGFEIALLTGKLSEKQKRSLYDDLKNGSIRMVIGTHALFQEKVSFENLGVVIIDEQHRFGVKERHRLAQKGTSPHVIPHQLVMTATPIPRTLAMSMYGDIVISVLDELPKGRSPIVTAAISNEKRKEVIERIKAHCASGQQVYWVCPAISHNNEFPLEAIETRFQELQTALPHVRVDFLHGKLKSAEKEHKMQQFRDNHIQVLVATTVIEVGVDVPNATLMVIENPERFGLAQLHQLRGRVGRGALQSYCVLLYQTPLSTFAKSRLEAMRHSQDGFYLAEQDLKLRGPGEVLGARQSGLNVFKIADFIRDQHLLESAAIAAENLTQQTPRVAQQLIDQWLPYHYQLGRA